MQETSDVCVGVPRENGVISPRDARFVWGITVELRLKTLAFSRGPLNQTWGASGRSRFGVETKWHRPSWREDWRLEIGFSKAQSKRSEKDFDFDGW